MLEYWNRFFQTLEITVVRSKVVLRLFWRLYGDLLSTSLIGLCKILWQKVNEVKKVNLYLYDKKEVDLQSLSLLSCSWVLVYKNYTYPYFDFLLFKWGACNRLRVLACGIQEWSQLSGRISIHVNFILAILQDLIEQDLNRLKLTQISFFQA